MNWVIIVLCLYAVGCCGFHILPTWGAATNYEDVNSVLLGLSLSYIAACIFYVLLTWWPNVQKRNILMGVWQGDMVLVFQYMGDAITSVLLYAGVTKTLDRVGLDDCKSVCTFDAKRPEVYHHVQFIVDGVYKEHPDGIFRYHHDLQVNADNVYRTVDKML